MNIVFFAVICLIALVTGSSDKKITRAVLESCPGCQLNRLSEVRAFAYDDLPKYENVEWKKIQGAAPELLFYDENDEVVEKHSLKPLTRQQCNALLTDRGFKLKSDNEL